ncbi:MAG TPA: ABC transporter ATP-binding protein [Bryobacteraceae bacterium]|nr:ABC transporter ATP-binding protein [Bryobacteraceae bacterium]
MHHVVRTESLVKRFGSVEALRGLEVEVPEHSVYALVGPNGAGKTTAIKIAMNILRPTSGRTEVLGTDSRVLAGDAFDAIGYVSENQELPDWMRVGDFLGHVRHFYPAWDRNLETELVRQFDLPLGRKLKLLSRGMRMKTALASSLAYHPKLIVLDEPFSGLDPLVRDELIRSLAERAPGATVFVSSHDLAEIESFATHVGYLHKGTLLFSEELATLSGRFREVEIVLQSSQPASDHWPSTWMQIDVLQGRVRFVESQFDADLTPQRIRTIFGEVGGVTYRPMPLRSIFVAIARTHGVPSEQERP